MCNGYISEFENLDFSCPFILIFKPKNYAINDNKCGKCIK